MKALLVSLGGSAEPIIVSASAHLPEFICFLVSQKSNLQINEVLASLNAKGFHPDHFAVVVDNENDLVDCFLKAQRCAEELSKRSYLLEDVIVDYTGGTKNMTAALVLATFSRGYRFSYVGGVSRTKNDLGTVISGHEKVFTGLSPWQLLEVEDRKRLALYFNVYQFESACAVIDELIARNPQEKRRMYEYVRIIIQAYAAWDQFAHSSARDHIDRLHKPMAEGLQFFDADNRNIFQHLRETLNTHSSILNKLAPRELKKPVSVTRNHVIDLLSNADRRAEEGKYDDAVARLYRSLEMIGQVAFHEKFGCSTSEVPLDKIPQSLKQDYEQRYLNKRDDFLALPLEATFMVLDEVGVIEGKQFIQNRKIFQDIQLGRNNSILAHGVACLDKAAFERFNTAIRSVFAITDRITYPKLLW